MKYCLIGYPLGHSWSPEIHTFLMHEPYEKKELKTEELELFFRKREFAGINITIPHKQTAMQYLDEIDKAAENIGAVNCVVNKNGRLCGYNTDYEGLKDMILANNIAIEGKKTAVLGSGGASLAAREVVKALGGIPVIVSRRARAGVISYEELYQSEKTFSVLINATPVGMFPDNDSMPVNLDKFTNLTAVVDVVANPLRTRLQFEAKMRGIPYVGGFEMLVRQAAAADRLFGKEVADDKIQACMNALYKEKRNIVIIGMPTSGKTTFSKIIAEKTGREAVEMDDLIERKLGTTIRECFDTKGEKYFRDIETEVAEECRNLQKKVISCGGGIIKREDNMRYLSENGIIVWLERAPENLYPTDSRPLSDNNDAIYRLYKERRALYEKYSDVTIDNNSTAEHTVRELLEKTGEEERI